MEVGCNMGVEKEAGAHIDDIEDFHDLLLLALRVGGHAGGILKIQLPRLERLGALQRLMGATRTLGDPAGTFEDQRDTAGGAGKSVALGLQLLQL
jgi:hypothetical protein